jgi:hypothetical protein
MKLFKNKNNNISNEKLEIEIRKEKGCDYCNTHRIKSMIGYQYMYF